MRGALIDQGIPYRLRDRAAARLWNSGLPCRADLTKVEDEGAKVLASFRLRAGPGGPCAGIVKVRFAFRDGRFSEFVQLPGEEPRAGRDRLASYSRARSSSIRRRSASRLSRRS